MVGPPPFDPIDAEHAMSSIDDPEPLIAELVSRFVDLALDDVDDMVVGVLERVALHVRAQRAIYASLTEDGRRVVRSHAWGEEPPGGAGPDAYEIAAFPWITRHLFAKHRILYVPDFERLPEGANADKRAWGPGVPAAAFIAGYGDRDPAGIIVLQWWSHAPGVSERDLRPFGVLSDVIAAGLRRKRSQEALRDREGRLRHAERVGAIERLAGGIAHDFNNVLAVILGCAESARAASPESSPVAARLSEIVRAVDRAKDLVDRLLAFARLRPTEPQPVDATALVAGLESIVRTLIGDRIQFVVRTEIGVPPVLIDPGQLQHIVMNLVANALDAMPDGGTLQIETAACGSDGSEPASDESPSWVRLSVLDSGIGMSEETLAHVFEPFFAGAAGVRSGLDLATCHGIVTGAGGRISAQRLSAEGTRFDVLLPATRLLHGTAAVPPPAATALAARGETILLVEDESAVRQVTARVLREQGYRVIEAHDGEDAWLLLTGTRGDEIDLVVADIVMPNLNGLGLAERLREMRPSARVLFVSGYSDEPALTRMHAMGPQSLLAKPFTARELLARVRAILRDDPLPED